MRIEKSIEGVSVDKFGARTYLYSMKTVALCMIVRDEQAVIGRLMESVKGMFDQIVIADTGSQDETINICSRYTDEIYDFEWCDDFSAARNYAFSFSRCDYTMWMDADDIVTRENRDTFMRLKSTLDGRVKQVLARYEMTDKNGRVTCAFVRERIVLTECGYTWSGAVHETLPREKNAAVWDFAVTHAKPDGAVSDRNLRIYRKLMKKRSLDTREQFYYARELYYNGCLSDAIEQFKCFLSKNDAWKENKIEAARDLYFAYKSTGENALAKEALLQSIGYGAPRPESCCALGDEYLCEGDLDAAEFWYTSALRARADMSSGAFIDTDSRGYRPCIQLAVVYDRMGDIKRSYEMNERAASFYPESEAVAANRKYFDLIKIK